MTIYLQPFRKRQKRVCAVHRRGFGCVGGVIVCEVWAEFGKNGYLLSS